MVWMNKETVAKRICAELAHVWRHMQPSEAPPGYQPQPHQVAAYAAHQQKQRVCTASIEAIRHVANGTEIDEAIISSMRDVIPLLEAASEDVRLAASNFQKMRNPETSIAMAKIYGATSGELPGMAPLDDIRKVSGWASSQGDQYSRLYQDFQEALTLLKYLADIAPLPPQQGREVS